MCLTPDHVRSRGEFGIARSHVNPSQRWIRSIQTTPSEINLIVPFQHEQKIMLIAFGFCLASINRCIWARVISNGGDAIRGAPAVGVITAEYKTMARNHGINGRIQSRQRVDLVPRVTAFLNERLFDEGAEVKNGQLLYRLERAPFEADVEAKQAAIARSGGAARECQCRARTRTAAVSEIRSVLAVMLVWLEVVERAGEGVSIQALSQPVGINKRT